MIKKKPATHKTANCQRACVSADARLKKFVLESRIVSPAKNPVITGPHNI